MALYVVATPIGNDQDFSLRALALLKGADLIIGEELKILRQTLKSAGVQGTTLDQLNEHSRTADIEHFVGECRTKSVVLVSDCGTPGFCDPGADLVAACVTAGVEVHSVPGPSSLMSLLSIAGMRVDRFMFFGFLPAKVELRKQAWNELKKMTYPFIVLETPYRTSNLLSDLAANFPRAHCVVGFNLTALSERIYRGQGSGLANYQPPENSEPIALIVPKTV